ncbi:NnrU family protein [Roseospira visakhapatnamensis]|uniref:Putative membrane protein n=1 Tax=Roseospira visakhapatnamensis TaxID=390880 RepID=A0A7W6W8Z0_9PROT|nr:NnrU family protein [Roseospira visakhapatnamensis]MBB4264902.1 putative membrane protein [Roseospira visakhapatnamensis]
MTEFLTALGVFLAAHVGPAVPPVRRALVRRLGEPRYLAIYAVVSTALLAWLIVAVLRAPYVHLWTPPLWTYWVPLVVMPAAFMLLCVGLITPNPLSISLSRAPFDPDRPGLVGWVRHPVLWGFGLWSLSHMPANGALVPAILFGVFTVFSFGGMPMVDRKRRRTMGPDAWRRLDAARRAGRAAGLPWTARATAGVALGLALTLAFVLWAHQALFGLSPVPLLGVGL